MHESWAYCMNMKLAHGRNSWKINLFPLNGQSCSIEQFFNHKADVGFIEHTPVGVFRCRETPMGFYFRKVTPKGFSPCEQTPKGFNLRGWVFKKRPKAKLACAGGTR